MIEGEIVERMQVLTRSRMEIVRKVLLVLSLFYVRNSKMRSIDGKVMRTGVGLGSTWIGVGGPSSFTRSLVYVRSGSVGIAIDLVIVSI